VALRLEFRFLGADFCEKFFPSGSVSLNNQSTKVPALALQFIGKNTGRRKRTALFLFNVRGPSHRRLVKAL